MEPRRWPRSGRKLTPRGAVATARPTVQRGTARGLRRYSCKSCGKWFQALTGTVLCGLHHKERWLALGRSLVDRGSARRCGGRYSVPLAASLPPTAGAVGGAAGRAGSGGLRHQTRIDGGCRNRQHQPDRIREPLSLGLTLHVQGCAANHQPWSAKGERPAVKGTRLGGGRQVRGTALDGSPGGRVGAFVRRSVAQPEEYPPLFAEPNSPGHQSRGRPNHSGNGQLIRDPNPTAVRPRDRARAWGPAMGLPRRSDRPTPRTDRPSR